MTSLVQGYICLFTIFINIYYFINFTIGGVGVSVGVGVVAIWE